MTTNICKKYCYRPCTSRHKRNARRKARRKGTRWSIDMNERWDLVMKDPEGVSRLVHLLAKRDKEEDAAMDTAENPAIVRKERRRKRAS
ncbi:MAG: hypothetical protein AB9903_07225 [Vulcanimicrobiota bacterium]